MIFEMIEGFIAILERLIGSKYEYWKVPGQKAIFEEDGCQNMILGIFGIKKLLLRILGLKHDFWEFWY